MFPFGYGLKYTHFTLSPVTLLATQLPATGSVTATVTLTNDGDRDGATVVQLYLHDVTASISRPVAMLQGFHKVFLKAGASQFVQFPLTPAMLRFYNQQMRLVTEPGEVEVMIGLDSARVNRARFTLQ